MVAFGNQSSFEFIICLNHTIHLTVLDVVFPKKNSINESVEEFDPDDQDEHDVDREIFKLNENYNETFSRMRAIVKFFKNSPVRNSILQESLKTIEKKPLQLLLDTKTRWNSLVISGKRFMELLPAVLDALQQLGSELRWDERNTKQLKVCLFIKFLSGLITEV